MLTTTLAALKSFPEQLELFFEAVPAGRLNWAPDSWDGVPSESLTALEQICHIRDIEIDGYHERFRRILNEDNPELKSVDGYALVKERNYAGDNPAEVFEDFRRARFQTLEIIENLTEEQLNRQGIFEGYGKVTTKALIHFLCSHDQQHLSGIQWLLGKME